MKKFIAITILLLLVVFFTACEEEKMPCLVCEGSKRSMCPIKRGAQFTGGTHNVPCSSCDGSGYVECFHCGGTGIEPE